MLVQISQVRVLLPRYLLAMEPGQVGHDHDLPLIEPQQLRVPDYVVGVQVMVVERDEITYDAMEPLVGWEPIADRYVKKQIEIEAKYEGYIKRQRESVAKMKASEQRKIAKDLDYDKIPGLSNELRMKFKKVEPATIGHAERIPGMTQAAINAVLIAMKKMELGKAPNQNTPKEVE